MDHPKKKQYEAPRQTVVEFKTELGFATSVDDMTATRNGYGNNDGQGDGGNNSQSWF